MATLNQTLDEVREAIATLHRAVVHDRDSRRSHTADWLDSLFSDIETPAQLRESANEALKLYRGGMGSFQDVGTAVMAQAVDGLHAALGAARSAALRN